MKDDNTRTESIALYIHIPFCRRKCSYCSFVSYPCREADIPAYVDALKKELEFYAGERLGTVYFGGGTPSLLHAHQIGDLLSTIDSLFTLEKGAEITIEANPGTVDEAYLRQIRAIGINRLSLGVQSFDDRELTHLGRLHNVEQAREAIESARKAGFDNLNLDLIYGLPGAALADWQRSLKEAVALEPEHLSLYCLTLEEGAPMRLAIERGELPQLDTDDSADQYMLAEDLLAAHGYHQYEISNWAKPGYECRHNLVYWHNQPYIGIGVAAHSCRNGHRFANTTDLDRYLSHFASKVSSPVSIREMEEEITPDLELAESIILGLRLNEGVALSQIKNDYGVDMTSQFGNQITELTNLGLLERNDGHLYLTRNGRLLGNEVFWRFLPE